MVILDLTAPASPTFEGEYKDASWYPTQVAVNGDYAYLAGYGGAPTKWRVRVIDVTPPASPTYSGQTSEVNDEIHDLIYGAGAVWITYGVYMNQVIVTNPASLSL